MSVRSKLTFILFYDVGCGSVFPSSISLTFLANPPNVKGFCQNLMMNNGIFYIARHLGTFIGQRDFQKKVN